MRLVRLPARAGAKVRKMPSAAGVLRAPARARGANAIALVAAVVFSAGCTSNQGGGAVKSTGAAPSTVNLAMLDPGSYPRTPRPPLGTVGNEDAGRLAESRRLADNTIGPWEVEPALIESHSTPTGAMSTTKSLTMVFSETLAGRAGAHHYLLGFVSGRTSAADDRILDNAVLRFASPEDAAAAAADLAATDPVTPLPIPRHPETLADTAKTAKGFEASAFTSHGTYLLYQHAGAKDSAGAVADLIARTLDLQGALIDRFQTTPVDQFATLPKDPAGLLARTVPAANPTIDEGAVFQPHGALHFRGNPDEAEAVFTEAGVLRVSIDRTTVYETVDTPGALRAVDGLIHLKDISQLGYKPVGGISGLPGARCFDRGSGQSHDESVRFMCVASSDRYAIQVTAAQEPDAHQAIAAQYLILAAA